MHGQDPSFSKKKEQQQLKSTGKSTEMVDEAVRMHHGHCLPSVQANNSEEHALRLQFFCSDAA
jgi:hypothetical protein